MSARSGRATRGGTAHILVVDDDRPLTDVLARGLARAAHTADVVHEGGEGWARAVGDVYDAVILCRDEVKRAQAARRAQAYRQRTSSYGGVR